MAYMALWTTAIVVILIDRQWAGGGRFLLTKALLEPCLYLKAQCIPLGVLARLEMGRTSAG